MSSKLSRAISSEEVRRFGNPKRLRKILAAVTGNNFERPDFYSGSDLRVLIFLPKDCGWQWYCYICQSLFFRYENF